MVLTASLLIAISQFLCSDVIWGYFVSERGEKYFVCAVNLPAVFFFKMCVRIYFLTNTRKKNNQNQLMWKVDHLITMCVSFSLFFQHPVCRHCGFHQLGFSVYCSGTGQTAQRTLWEVWWAGYGKSSPFPHCCPSIHVLHTDSDEMINAHTVISVHQNLSSSLSSSMATTTPTTDSWLFIPIHVWFVKSQQAQYTLHTIFSDTLTFTL